MGIAVRFAAPEIQKTERPLLNCNSEQGQDEQVALEITIFQSEISDIPVLAASFSTNEETSHSGYHSKCKNKNELSATCEGTCLVRRVALMSLCSKNAWLFGCQQIGSNHSLAPNLSELPLSGSLSRDQASPVLAKSTKRISNKLVISMETLVGKMMGRATKVDHNKDSTRS